MTKQVKYDKQEYIKKRKKRLDRMEKNMLKEQLEKDTTVGAPEIDEVINKVNKEQKEEKADGVEKMKVDKAIWAYDQTVVLNKDPDMHYIFARKDEQVEIAIASRKGYAEAVGNEIIFGMTHPTPGKPKILNGDRILLCCPQAKVDARNQAMLSRRATQHRHGNKNKAEELQHIAGDSIGVSVFDGKEK